RIDEPHDVGMQQLGAQLRFTAEALDVALRIAPAAILHRAQNLHGDDLAGGRLPRLEHLPEAPPAELPQDLVALVEEQRSLLSRRCGYRRFRRDTSPT